MAERICVRKYGSTRKALPIPKDVENELKVGDCAEAVVDREKGTIMYFFKDKIKQLNDFEN